MTDSIDRNINVSQPFYPLDEQGQPLLDLAVYNWQAIRARGPNILNDTTLTGNTAVIGGIKGCAGTSTNLASEVSMIEGKTIDQGTYGTAGPGAQWYLIPSGNIAQEILSCQIGSVGYTAPNPLLPDEWQQPIYLPLNNSFPEVTNNPNANGIGFVNLSTRNLVVKVTFDAQFQATQATGAETLEVCLGGDVPGVGVTPTVGIGCASYNNLTQNQVEQVSLSAIVTMAGDATTWGASIAPVTQQSAGTANALEILWLSAQLTLEVLGCDGETVTNIIYPAAP
jgi:hypothetical protein